MWGCSCNLRVSRFLLCFWCGGFGEYFREKSKQLPAQPVPLIRISSIQISEAEMGVVLSV